MSIDLTTIHPLILLQGVEITADNYKHIQLLSQTLTILAGNPAISSLQVEQQGDNISILCLLADIEPITSTPI